MEAARSRSARAASNAAASPPNSQPIRPIYVRLPARKARCPYTGLSRSGLADLCVPSKNNNFRASVKSFRLKRKGDKRAVRLIVFESLINYLRQFEQEAA
jgi:hypothetical protein